MLLKFLNGIILLHICSELTIINVWFQQHGEMGTLPCEAMAQTPKSCLLLLAIVVDDDGNKNSIFTSHLITTIFSETAV